MQIGNKPVRDWKNILLDTGVILALLVKQSDDEGILFIKKLVGFYAKIKLGHLKIGISTYLQLA